MGLTFQRKVTLFALIFSLFISGCGQTTTSKTPTENTPTPATTEQQASNSSEQTEPTVSGIATYEGQDRDQRLIEAAKKEGELNLYTSMAIEDAQKVAEGFEKKYGIKVNLWRAGSEKVLQRIVTEAQGGRFDFDIVETNGPELEAIQREKLLQEVTSPYLKDLMPEALFEHKEWVATRMNVFVQAYNTDKVNKEELPQTWDSLLDNKWKGQLAIEAEDVDWFFSVVKLMGEEEGLQYFKNLVATNGLSIRKGHAQLTKLVASGEIPYALTVYNYKAEQLKSKGAPIDWYAIEPAIARPNGVGMSRKSLHPNAAVLYFDYLISDAQQILADRNFVPSSTKVETSLNDMKLKFVDPAVILDENEKWTKLWNEIILNRK
jgi:iron(III) transport system substrate-binding protein